MRHTPGNHSAITAVFLARREEFAFYRKPSVDFLYYFVLTNVYVLDTCARTYVLYDP